MSGRHVNGALFVETARMLRERKLAIPTHWNVTSDDWYPVETFERIALAWLHVVAAGKPAAFSQLGAHTADALLAKNPALLAAGDIRESLMRFLVVRQSLFDFPAFSVCGVSDADAQLELRHGLHPLAEQAASFQTAGFLVRLLELSGARDIDAKFVGRSWDGDPHTTLEITWQS